MKIKEVRAIDANRFKENILSGLYVFCQENKEDIARAIDDEPTIEIPSIYEFKGCDNCELERPNGKWLHDDLYLDCRCSLCNSYALERGDYPELSAYCPACGAKMKLED